MNSARIPRCPVAPGPDGVTSSSLSAAEPARTSPSFQIITPSEHSTRHSALHWVSAPREHQLAEYVPVRSPSKPKTWQTDAAPSYQLHGGLNARRRDELLESFKGDPELRVLFSTDAGGLGLNLQDSASIVVNLEVPWNPAVLEQRIGRVHRMGQRNSVQVLHFVTRGAMEERVRLVLEGKRALFDGLLVDEADRITFDVDRRSTFVDKVRTLIDDADA